MRLSCFLLVFISTLLIDSQVSKDTSAEVCEDEPPAKKLKSSCYFAVPRSSPLELVPRDDKFKVSTSCSSGPLHPMIHLATNHDGRMFGAPHELAFVTSGGEGEFLDESSDLSRWEQEGICDDHLNELSRHFSRNAHPRFSLQKISGSNCVLCAYPKANHQSKAVVKMSYQKSHNLLRAKNILVPPGTPLCKRCYDEIPAAPPASPSHSFSMNDDFSMGDPAPSTGGEDWGSKPFPSYGGAMPVPEFTNAQGPMPSGDFTNTQGAIPCGKETDTEDGDDDECEEGKDDNPRSEARSFFKKFVKKSNIKRATCNKKYSTLAERTQKEKVRTVRQILLAVIAQMVESVEDQQLLLTHFMDLLTRLDHKDENAMFKAVMTDVANQFDSLKNSKDKIQLLSMFAPHVKYPVLFSFIPDLAENLYYDAKRKGMNPEKTIPDVSKRERYDALKLEYFISFITSPYLLVGLPYGEKRTKDSSGKTVILPNTIRLMGIFESIELYETWMRQNKRESLILSSSTTHKLMSSLPAIRSSSRTCVDYFAASATMAFVRIREMLKELTEMSQMEQSEESTYKHSFDEAEVYLRTDYKLHVKEESWVSDHCINHALSDPEDARFASPPKEDHQHDQKCPKCEKMDYIFREMKKKLQTMVDAATAENEMKLLDIQNEFEISIEKILDLKSHHVRTVFTSMEREAKIRGLQEGECFITLDFAQKWLPSFFRETQKDFFGKPGYSWHFAHVYAVVNGELVQHVYIHIFKNEVQNGALVVELIKHMAEDLAKMGIRIMHLRSDNAGYYHSGPVMATINKIAAQFKMDIASWSFSEAQSGKSTADRYCALSKGVMRCYMAKGNNIDTHEKMFIALTKGKQLRGVSVHLGTVSHKDLPKTKINGISNLGHFEFNGKDTISAWRFRGIGKGMEVSGLAGIESSVVWHEHGGKLWRDGLMNEDKHKIASGEEPHFWFFPKKNKSPEPGDVDSEAATGEPLVIDSSILEPSSPLFVCSQCSSRFIRHANLLRHIESGRHKIRPEKVSQFDFALGMYKRMLEEVQQGVNVGPLADTFKKFQEAPAHPKPMGWALRTTKKGARYNVKAKQLVVDLFEEYFKQSKKLRAEEAEKKMKENTEIQPSERMSHDQIKNCIRGLLAAKKKEIEKHRGSRRRRALVEDMITELDEEGGVIEEEVDVDEDDREITADDIYDMIHMNMAEFFDDPTNIVVSTDVGNVDE